MRRVAREGRVAGGPCCCSMVLPLLELVPELQAHFVLLLADAATAGRLAQTSHACKLLLQQRLVELHDERRLAARAQLQAQRQRKHTALLQFFEAVDGGAYHTCKAHAMDGGTPCGKRLRASSSLATTNRRLMLHLRDCHATEYGMLIFVFEM
jgi:hypothetical protein